MTVLTGNVVLVAKRLELAVGPRVENPVAYVGPSFLGLVAGLVPGFLDLVDESILAGSGAILGLDALGFEIVGEVGDGPRAVRLDSIVVPVFLDKLLEVLAIRRGGVGHVVVREPALKFGLVPRVIGWGCQHAIILNVVKSSNQ